MLDSETKRRIDTARDILVGKIPDPKSQIEQITIALIYKFMDDMDKKSEELGGKAKFFTGDYSKYAWNKLMDASLSGFELVNVYGEAIQSMNQNPNAPQLFRDIFKNAYLPYRDPSTLKSFLKIIDDFTYDHSERLGDAFEYLLSVMSSQGDAGQFRTPRHIIEFIVDVVDPSINDTILDPACGTAGFLISAYKHILEKHLHKGKNTLTPDERKKLVENVVGYDISPDMVRLSLVNLYLHGFKNPAIYEYDTLTSDEKWDETFDVCLANPPFMTPKGGIRPHKRFSVSSNRAEVLFVDYMHEHLNNDGRAGIIVPEGIIFQSGNTYKQLRKNLLQDSLYAVVSLPAGVFNPYSGVKTSILLLDKKIAKKCKDVLFVKVSADGYNLGAQRREIKENDLPLALEVLKEFQTSALEGVEPQIDKFESTIAHIVSKDKIKEQDYNLSGDRYKEEAIYDGNWDLVELGEVAEIKRGSTITQKTAVKGEIPVIAGGQQPAYYHNKSNREGNIITVSGSGAYSGFVTFHQNPIFASDCFTIKSLNESKLLTKYIYHLLKGKQDEIYKFQSGGGQPHVYPKDLIPYKIPLPPLEVQERIVEEIESYQNIIDGAKKVVESYKPSFKIESDWDVVELDNVVHICRGGSPRPIQKYLTKNKDGINWIKIGDTKGVTKYITSTKEKIIPEGLSKSREVKEGDFILSNSMSFGKPYIMKTKGAIHDGWLLLRIESKNIIQDYLYYVLSSELIYKAFKLLATGGVVQNLNSEKVRKVKIPLPPIETQKEIVSRIEEEQKLVDSNKQLIEIFENKIKDKISEVWGK
jgi:type I restriction enzyme M protein